jgi:hypothetical protein
MHDRRTRLARALAESEYSALVPIREDAPGSQQQHRAGASSASLEKARTSPARLHRLAETVASGSRPSLVAQAAFGRHLAVAPRKVPNSPFSISSSHHPASHPPPRLPLNTCGSISAARVINQLQRSCLKLSAIASSTLRLKTPRSSVGAWILLSRVTSGSLSAHRATTTTLNRPRLQLRKPPRRDFRHLHLFIISIVYW